MTDPIAVCFWSSGKDSCLALYKALQQGYQIQSLVNFISREYGRVSFHGTKNDLVKLQSEAIGIPLLQRETTKEDYEEVFREMLSELKEANIKQIVRGDIHLQDLKDWVQDICNNLGIGVISPLWQRPTEDLLREFIGCGFQAVVTSCQADKLESSWVGRTIDEQFIAELKSLKGVDLCGENGEFHSFVYDGPIFSKRINITKIDKLLINGFWFLDIQEYELLAKGDKK